MLLDDGGSTIWSFADGREHALPIPAHDSGSLRVDVPSGRTSTLGEAPERRVLAVSGGARVLICGAARADTALSSICCLRVAPLA